MSVTVKNDKPYSFDPLFERQVVTLVCSNPRFYGRIGQSLDPELLKYEPAKFAVRAAHAIYKDVGHGPAAAVLVIQRLRGWMVDGKVKLETIKDVADMFDDAEDAGLPDVESVIAELAPMLRQRIRDEAVRVAIESFGQKGDLSRAVALEEKATRVGVTDTSVGTVLGPESWAEIAALKDIERMPIGVVELDAQLDGGLQRGGLGILVGGPGDGKSMGLSHIASVNLMQGAFVAYATLELPKAEVLARVKANMTGVPINVLKSGDTKAARERLASFTQLGHFVVQEFTAYATTVEDIVEWLDQCQQFYGRKVDLLITDYGDKIGVKSRNERDKAEYTSGRIVFEALRIHSHDNKMFSWTASQATRQKDRKKRLDLNDVADSIHKVRIGDLVITLNVIDDDSGEPEIKLFVAKHRTGKGRFEVGPYPTAYEVGQMVTL